MRFKKFLLHMIVVCMILLIGVPSAWAAELRELVILSVNDFHGNLMESDEVPGLAKLAAVLKNEKKQAEGKAVLLSAGDMLQGSVESNLTLGAPVIAAMNALEFDAMALGNHEFDWGIETLQKRNSGALFPFLAANMVDEKAMLASHVKPYTIVRRNGLKLGIIGLTTPQTKTIANPKFMEGITFTDGAQTVNKLVPELKAKGADLIVVLAHMGSVSAEDGTENGEIIELAKQVTDVDLIVSGHTHQLVNTKVNGIPIVQAGKNGIAYSKVNITYDKKAKKVVSVMPEIMQIEKDKVEADLEFANYIEYIDTRVSHLKNEKVGEVAVDLWHNRYAESLLGQYVTDVIRKHEQVDFAVVNGGGLRHEIAKGFVTKGDLYAAIPFDNIVVKTSITGREMKNLLEYGLGNNGYGLLQFSGVSVTFDSSQAEGSRIVQILLPNGKPMDPATEYTIATIDFVAAGGDGFTVFKDKQVVSTGILLRDILQDSFSGDEVIHDNLDDRLIVLQTSLLAG